MPTTVQTIGAGSRNLARFTEDLTDAYWSTAGTGARTANQAAGSDGTDTLTLLDDQDAAVSFTIYHDFTIVDALPYTWSGHYRPDTATESFIWLRQQGTGNPEVSIIFDQVGNILASTNTGPAGSNFEISQVPNQPGLLRIQVTLVAQTSVSAVMRAEFIADAEDPTSENQAFFGDVQFEQHPSATAYQPVLGATDTRLGDFTTTQAWLDATRDLDLVLTSDIREGRRLDDVEDLTGAATALLDVSIGAGTRGPNAYRRLTWDPSVIDSYKGWEHSGPRYYVQWASQTGDQYGIDIQEDYFRMDGVSFISDDRNEVPQAPSDVKALVRVRGSFVQLHNVWSIAEEGGRRDPTGALGPLFYCFWINGGSGTEAQDVVLYNCTARGSKFAVGATFGFYFDAFSQGLGPGSSTIHGCWNCAAYDFTRGTTTRAFFSSAATAALGPQYVNCYGAGTQGTPGSPTDFGGLIFRHAANVSSDGSALAVFGGAINGRGELSTPDTEVPEEGYPGSKTYIGSTSAFVGALVRDTRMKTSSPLRGAALDDRNTLLSHLTPAQVFQDADGDGRGAARWSVGPYEATANPPTLAPTVVEDHIGVASFSAGRSFRSIQDWLDATEDLHLFNLNQIRVGIVHDDTLAPIDLGSTSLLALHTVADENHYRHLKSADDTEGEQFNRWVPHLGRGVHVQSTTGTANDNIAVLEALEPHFRVDGIKFENTHTGINRKAIVRLRGHHSQMDACEAAMLLGTDTNNIGVEIQADECLITNVLSRGSGNGTSGLVRGFEIHDCIRSRLYHCVADSVDGNGAGRGFTEVEGADRTQIENCIGAASQEFDFHFQIAANGATGQSNNISTDVTADGVQSQTNVVRATIWNDPDNDDFRLIATSPALDRGNNVSFFIDHDFAGDRRLAPSDLGIYEGIIHGAQMGRRIVRNDLAELASMWQIVRRDGQAFYFTDANEPIVFLGQTYTPTNSINASARQGQAGLQDASVNVAGQISSDAITETDLRVGRFRGARATEFLIDWQFPFATEQVQGVQIIDGVRQTSEAWSADFLGVANKLERNAGGQITITCPYVVGDLDCAVDLSADTQNDVRVDTVLTGRLSFLADLADISASFADDFFGNGELYWITGDNFGLFSTVKSYTQQDRGFTLENETELTITVGDTFRIKPGCRKRYVPDCITKFSNGRRYGGDPHIPKVTDQLEAPRR